MTTFHGATAVLTATALAGAGWVVVSAAGAAGAADGPSPAALAAAAKAGNYAAFDSKRDSIGLHGRGNGHGHGMSQYGAQGAAIAGLTSAQIVQFYYPGTTLKTLSPSTIRVSLSNAGDYTTVSATTPGLTLSGYGALPSGYEKFRLSPSGSGLALGSLRSGGDWHRLKDGLPSRADFSSSVGFTRLYLTDGSSTRYRGTIGAVRNGSGLLTINRVSLDNYAMGVAPREMPSSWRPAAVGAQAIAARTYGRNAVESHGSSSYDICDTTWCQVYGGMTHYSSSGAVLWNDDPDAIVGNQNEVLQYGGQTIFAQFSASNGGAMLDGGYPYLPGKADPYDNDASGDPYLDWSDTTSASGLASYYGLASVSSVLVTKRNGYGPWGGWVLAAQVSGRSYSGDAKTVDVSGSSLASAMGARTSYFHFDDAPQLPGRVLDVAVSNGDAGATVTWTAPSNADAADLSGYRLHWGRFTETVPASARSAYITPIYQNTSQTVWVRALNSVGAGPSGAASVHGVAAPELVVPISTQRVFAQSSVTNANPYTVTLGGRGSIPTSGATSAQLAVTIMNTTASGSLDVYVAGATGGPVATLAYGQGRMTTQTISVPLRPSDTLRFVPSAGTVDLTGEQQSYTASWGRNIKPVTPTLAGTIGAVSTDGSTTVSLLGLPGVTSNTKAALLNIQAWTDEARGALKIWPDNESEPTVLHATVAPYGANTNTVLARVPADGIIHVAANRAGFGARITLLGLVGNGGGRLEALPTNPIVDTSVASRPARWVGPDVRTLSLLGIAQTPSTGVDAVLAQISVTATHEAGKLYAWPTGAARPSAAVDFIAKGETQTAMTVLMVGPDGRVNLQANTPGLLVSVRSMGYLTTS